VDLTFIAYHKRQEFKKSKRFDTPLLIDGIKLVRNQPVCNSRRSSSIVIEAPFVLITAILRRQRLGAISH
jgi:hypothetical protein